MNQMSCKILTALALDVKAYADTREDPEFRMNDYIGDRFDGVVNENLTYLLRMLKNMMVENGSMVKTVGGTAGVHKFTDVPFDAEAYFVDRVKNAGLEKAQKAAAAAMERAKKLQKEAENMAKVAAGEAVEEAEESTADNSKLFPEDGEAA